MMTTQFQRDVETATVTEKGQSPEEGRYENVCLLLALGPQEMKPVLTETLNLPRSQEILRTHQCGTNTRAPTQCQEAKARDA